MLAEHDRVVLTDDISDTDLKAGDVGTIVHVYPNAEAFEVEFLALDGNTAALATVLPSQMRPVAYTDITHARKIRMHVIASWTPPSREPARTCLTFRGKPVVDAHGISADFGATVVKAFTNAVAAIGASQRAPLGAYGRLPNREDYQLLITDTALGSFGFELEEAPRDNSFSEAPHADFFRGASPIESAIKQTMSILEATIGTDETGTNIIADTHPRALKLLRVFLKKLVDQEAVCALEFEDDVFRFSDVGQVRRSEKRLSQDNIDKEERESVSHFPDVSQARQIENRSIQENIDEEEQEISGQFRGVLPTRRTFEFLNEATEEVISGEIDPAIEDVDEINKILNRPANIKVRSRRVDAARRHYVLLVYKDASSQGKN